MGPRKRAFRFYSGPIRITNFEEPYAMLHGIAPYCTALRIEHSLQGSHARFGRANVIIAKEEGVSCSDTPSLTYPELLNPR